MILVPIRIILVDMIEKIVAVPTEEIDRLVICRRPPGSRRERGGLQGGPFLSLDVKTIGIRQIDEVVTGFLGCASKNVDKIALNCSGVKYSRWTGHGL